MSIRLRLTLGHTVLLALVLACFAAVVYFSVDRQLTSQLEYAIHLQAFESSRSVHEIGLGQSGGRVQALPIAATTALADQRVFVQILDTSGRPLALSDNLAQPLPTPTGSLQLAIDQGESHATLTIGAQQIELLSTALILDDEFVGVLQVAAPLQPLQSSLAQLRLLLVASVLGATGVAGCLAWLLAGRALRPVDRLTRAADAIGRSADLTSRVPEPAVQDELGRLAGTFNSMLARLEETVKNQQRFLADASHELRTPLTAMRINVEALLSPAATQLNDRDEALRAIAHETGRLSRLVADLLALARADAGQPIVRSRLALEELLLEVYQQTYPLTSDVNMVIGNIEQLEVLGDAERLKQLLLNLVDNALRYTPAGGLVTLELRRVEDSAMLSVRDSGLGIPVEHQAHIFERFYRVDRQRSGATGGTGLGLAICKWVAEVHGGTIAVDSRPGFGSTFAVRLPLAASVAPSDRRTIVLSTESSSYSQKSTCVPPPLAVE